MTQSSQLNFRGAILGTQIDLQDVREVAPLEDQADVQGVRERDANVVDTPPMNQEEEQVLVGEGVHTKVLKKAKEKKSKAKEFNHRMSPKWLYQLITNLNDKQQEVVKEIGIRGFLHLKTDMTLAKLAVLLVRNFDICSCFLLLAHGTMRVTEEDVYLTLGLPKGSVEVIEADNESDGREH